MEIKFPAICPKLYIHANAPPRTEQSGHHKWISQAQHKKELRSRKLVECAAKIVRPVRDLLIKCKKRNQLFD